MADINSLVAKVRIELGDLGKSFVTQFVSDGTTNRFRLHYAPLDAAGVTVYANGTNITSKSSVEESTGTLVVDLTYAEFPSLVNSGTVVPKSGVAFTVSGTYYRYFTASEVSSLVSTAVEQHTAKQIDVIGRKFTVENLPTLDEYPVAVYATTLALYTLATDASFDIDIAAPDGVSIPRSERYRQLMEMIQTRQQQYRELCVMLGVGLYSIDVFTFRRISKTTNRYVPVYKPQEVDDRSFPQRARMALPTYGNEPTVFPTEDGELTAYQGRAFTADRTLTSKNYAGKTFVANVVLQRGSLQIVQGFELNVNSSLPNFAITNAARTAGSTTITLTTNMTHNLTVGTSVVITDVDTTVNGTRTITAVTSTTFTVTATATTVLALSALTGTVDVNANQNYTFTLSLTADQTRYLANRTWWEIRAIDPFTDESLVIYESHLFTVRSSEVIL